MLGRPNLTLRQDQQPLASAELLPGESQQLMPSIIGSRVVGQQCQGQVHEVSRHLISGNFMRGSNVVSLLRGMLGNRAGILSACIHTSSPWTPDGVKVYLPWPQTWP